MRSRLILYINIDQDIKFNKNILSKKDKRKVRKNPNLLNLKEFLVSRYLKSKEKNKKCYISHRSGCVGVAFAKGKFGIDIEEIRDRDFAAVADFCFGKDERELCGLNFKKDAKCLVASDETQEKAISSFDRESQNINSKKQGSLTETNTYPSDENTDKKIFFKSSSSLSNLTTTSDDDVNLTSGNARQCALKFAKFDSPNVQSKRMFFNPLDTNTSLNLKKIKSGKQGLNLKIKRKEPLSLITSNTQTNKNEKAKFNHIGNVKNDEQAGKKIGSALKNIQHQTLDPKVIFYQIYTIKEALVKALNLGFSELNLVNAVQNKFNCKSFVINDKFVVSVVFKGKKDIILKFL